MRPWKEWRCGLWSRFWLRTTALPAIFPIFPLLLYDTSAQRMPLPAAAAAAALPLVLSAVADVRNGGRGGSGARLPRPAAIVAASAAATSLLLLWFTLELAAGSLQLALRTSPLRRAGPAAAAAAATATAAAERVEASKRRSRASSVQTSSVVSSSLATARVTAVSSGERCIGRLALRRASSDGVRIVGAKRERAGVKCVRSVEVMKAKCAARRTASGESELYAVRSLEEVGELARRKRKAEELNEASVTRFFLRREQCLKTECNMQGQGGRR